MAEWRQVLDIDLLGVVRGCRLFLPAMLAQGHGQILSTASFAGLASAPGMMTYGVAKASVVAMSEQLRAEVHSAGIRVGVICPSFFRTNLIDTAIGSEKVKKLALKLMDNSSDTLDSVSDNVFAAAERGEFMIIPTRREPMRWRFKRWFPNLYFKQLNNMIKKQTQGAQR
jgi:short-subunit dehydrogenase